MPDGKTIVSILIGAIILVVLATSGIFFAGTATHDDVEFDSQRERIDVDSSVVVDSLDVRAGLGDAVALTGANDSEVTTEQTVDLDDTWTVCSYATAAQAVVDNDESRIIAGEGGGVVYYDGSADEYRVYTYDSGSRDSYAAGVAAPSPTTRTLVCGDYNGTHLRASRNTTVGTPVETTGDSYVDLPDANWNGTLEETRVYDHVLSANERQQYVDQPSLSINGTIPDARLMYDVRDRSVGGLLSSTGDKTIEAYFIGGDAEATSVSFADGVEPVSIDEGVDYETRNYNHTLILLDGGILGTGDVLFVDWTTGGGDRPRQIIQWGIVLALLAVLVIPLMRYL